jgi:hypothetical protein
MDAPTAHRQVGTHEDVLVFVRDLVELAARLGRPRPEVRGYRLFEERTRELAIRVVCQVRGKEVPPTSPEFTFEVIERNWGDGLMRLVPARSTMGGLTPMAFPTRLPHTHPSAATFATPRPFCTTRRSIWTMSGWSPTREALSWPFFVRTSRSLSSHVTVSSLPRGRS